MFLYKFFLHTTYFVQRYLSQLWQSRNLDAEQILTNQQEICPC